jgi:hypothetical protein
VPTRVEYVWPWPQINAEATSQYGTSIDIRQKIIDSLASEGFTGDYPALHLDNGPIIDTYMPLVPRDNADADSPSTIVTGADDQPFPFYGRVTVSWKP